MIMTDYMTEFANKGLLFFPKEIGLHTDEELNLIDRLTDPAKNSYKTYTIGYSAFHFTYEKELENTILNKRVRELLAAIDPETTHRRVLVTASLIYERGASNPRHTDMSGGDYSKSPIYCNLGLSENYQGGRFKTKHPPAFVEK